MLSNISWNEFILGLLILCTLYYAYIGIRYYRKDISKLMKRKVKHAQTTSFYHSTSASSESEQTQQAEEELFSAVEQLTTKIKSTIKTAISDGESASLLQYKLRDLVRAYPQVYNAPAFKIAISNVIETETHKSEHLAFTAEMIGEVWS